MACRVSGMNLYSAEVTERPRVVCNAVMLRAVATVVLTTAVASLTTGDACRRHQCSSTERCVVRSRDGRARCVSARRLGALWSHRRAPAGPCRHGYRPTRHRRRCRGWLRHVTV